MVVVVLVPGKVVVVLLLYNVILIMLCTVKWPNPCLESPVPSKTMVQVQFPHFNGIILC